MDTSFKDQTALMKDIHHYAWRAKGLNETVYLDDNDLRKFDNWTVQVGCCARWFLRSYDVWLDATGCGARVWHGAHAIEVLLSDWQQAGFGCVASKYGGRGLRAQAPADVCAVLFKP